MIAFVITLFLGIAIAVLLYASAVLYLLFGAWLADRVPKSAPTWVCYLTIALVPGLMLAAAFLLGDFAMGVILSVGFH